MQELFYACIILSRIFQQVFYILNIDKIVLFILLKKQTIKNKPDINFH